MFQLTTSRRGRRRGGHPVRTSGGFNSRPHEEVDLNKETFTGSIKCFNSRPHEEVDDNAPVRLSTTSLFQLTTSRRGRRQSPDCVLVQKVVSTHDLTKRSTWYHAYCREFDWCFNSRPHEEVDDFLEAVGKVPIEFQLTTSRRGRPVVSAVVRLFIKRFNSRPHEEVDHVPYDFAEIIDVSTHDLTKRSTQSMAQQFQGLLFQLTTSRRGRPFLVLRLHD